MLGLQAAAGTERKSNDIILGGSSITGKQPGSLTHRALWPTGSKSFLRG